MSRIKEELIERRLYQTAIAEAALKRSTLVVLPTGMGKTVIALLVIDGVLERKGGKILFLAPTRPLAEQHYSSILLRTTMSNVVLMTGEMPPEKRREMWSRAAVIVATPQVVENDMEFIDLSDFSLIVFDECHRATGDYPYVHIAVAYRSSSPDPLVLGMTASPGSDMARVEEVCRTLGIEHIEVRTEEDPDVLPYIPGIRVRWIETELPAEVRRISSSLKEMFRSRVEELQRMGVMEQNADASIRELLDAARAIAREIGSNPSGQMFRALKVHAEAMKLGHAVILAETQPLVSLKAYFRKLQSEANSRKRSASAQLLANERFSDIVAAVDRLKAENPKLLLVRNIVEDEIRNNPNGRIIIFTQYRDSVDAILSHLNFPGVRAGKLVGQGNRGRQKGLKQKEQIGVLAEFRKGNLNVLVSTSVGEEGLDIISTDLVVFFEPVPSEIRSIQRKGRTGRASAGRVIVLMCRGTIDEAYYHVSRRRERMMKENLMRLESRLSGAPRQKTILDF